MKLPELIEVIKERNLTRAQLEEYRDEMTNLFALVHLEMADLEKAEALFLMQGWQPDTSDIAKRRAWNSSEKGQKMIQLKHESKALEKMLSSLKSRIYAIY